MALTDNLVSYWKLDSNSNDSVTTNNGTDTAISYTAAGKIGNCATFNGSTSEIALPNLGVSGTAARSYSVWLKLDAGGNGVIFFMGTRGTTDLNWSTGSGSMEVTSNSGASFFSTGSPLTEDVWHHCAFTFDGSADPTSANVKLYVDGQSIETSQPTEGSWNQSNNNYNIGEASFLGYLDEFAVWSRALSGAEITSLYNGGTGFQYPFAVSGPTNLKTYNTNAKANIKTINTNPIANVKSLNTNT